MTIVNTTMLTNTTTAATGAADISSTFDPSAEWILNLRERNQTFSDIQRTTGSISLIASTCIILHILRSHHGLTTTYHRLVFGMCVSDILSSFFGWVLNTTMVPKEMNYIIPGAQGNVTTCTIQGFLFSLGMQCAVFYNCAICLYYLAIIKYNKSDEFILKKLEKWFHLVPTTLAFLRSLTILPFEGYNAGHSICMYGRNSVSKPHCEGYNDVHYALPEGLTIPCSRGVAVHRHMSSVIFRVFFFAAPPIVIIGTMMLMYRTVAMIENRSRKYGISSLRLRGERMVPQHTSAIENNSGTREQGNLMNRIQNSWLVIMSMLVRGGFRFHRNNHAVASRLLPRVVSRKRPMLYMALGYSLAWALVWLPTILFVLFTTRLSSRAIFISIYILWPLQGFFNFVMFMLPKVRDAKRNHRGPEISWAKAFIKAFCSRGQKKREQNHVRTTTRTSSNFRKFRFTALSSKLSSKRSGRSAIALPSNGDVMMVASKTKNDGKEEESQTNMPA